MKLTKILFIFFAFPTFLVGQNISEKLDSIFDINSIDTTKRPVYLCGEIAPTLINGEKIETYIYGQLDAFKTADCCAFKTFIGFVVEVDSTITNRKIFVKSVFCKDKGLIYAGKELSEIQIKIDSLLDRMPKLVPGKLGNKNIAIRVIIPIHIDYQ